MRFARGTPDPTDVRRRRSPPARSLWAERLGLEIESNSPFVAGLVADGVIPPEAVVEIDGETHFVDAVAAADPDGVLPRFLFQRVPEPKTAKNRLHLDVSVPQDDLDDHVAAWEAARAILDRYDSHPGHRWAVMADPDGNEFCLH